VSGKRELDGGIHGATTDRGRAQGGGAARCVHAWEPACGSYRGRRVENGAEKGGRGGPGAAGGCDRRAVGAGVGTRLVAHVGGSDEGVRRLGESAARGTQCAGLEVRGDVRGRAATPRGWAHRRAGARRDMPGVFRLHRFDRV
jgi:hypothetical protein